jgi:iron complex transport system permease protein
MRNNFFFILIILGIAFLFMLGLHTGSFDIDFNVILDSIFNYNPADNLHYIIINLRMPRVILAFLVGGALAFSGYLMQAMVNNPLADPYILGTASGASLGANIVYLVLPLTSIHVFLPSMFGFVGAILVTLIAIFIANHKGQIMPTKLLLTGIALSSLTVSLISLMIFFSDDESKLKTVIFWSMGSFEMARWEYLPLLTLALLIIVGAFSFLNKHLNILLLGESRSFNLGLNVKKMRWLILISSSILTGFSVATCGPIGFVGLMVPHFVRGIYGTNGKYNILYTTILGGFFMLVCDIIAKKIYPPMGIPIGIITSFLGIPFFVYLLSKRNYRFS